MRRARSPKVLAVSGPKGGGRSLPPVRWNSARERECRSARSERAPGCRPLRTPRPEALPPSPPAPPRGDRRPHRFRDGWTAPRTSPPCGNRPARPTGRRVRHDHPFFDIERRGEPLDVVVKDAAAREDENGVRVIVGNPRERLDEIGESLHVDHPAHRQYDTGAVRDADATAEFFHHGGGDMVGESGIHRIGNDADARDVRAHGGKARRQVGARRDDDRGPRRGIQRHVSEDRIFFRGEHIRAVKLDDERHTGRLRHQRGEKSVGEDPVGVEHIGLLFPDKPEECEEAGEEQKRREQEHPLPEPHVSLYGAGIAEDGAVRARYSDRSEGPRYGRRCGSHAGSYAVRTLMFTPFDAMRSMSCSTKGALMSWTKRG